MLCFFLLSEYEAEQPTFPDVYESKQESVSIVEAKKSSQVKTVLFYPGSPREYLEYYIFPVLLPGMAELLHQAEKEKCFERKRTKFIACDFLTEWLYNQNPKRKDESFTEFFSIPFVNDWLKDHPRPPIPLSLLLSEEAASKVIQSFWRGYRVRCDPEVKELRQWQKQLREDKNVIKSLKEFWIKQEAKGKLTKLDIFRIFFFIKCLIFMLQLRFRMGCFFYNTSKHKVIN
uniref:IQ motif containing K n=1 Tax=Apteryx owenii TaxID=8824 RepID=A0A8B9NTP9_APTOW